MPRALIVSIFGDARQFAAELDKAAGKTRRLSAAAGVAGGALAGGLAYGLERSVKAAMAGQVSQQQLDIALQNTHQSLQAMAGPLGDAEAASRKLGFADDDTRVALAKLETATGDTGKSITDLALAEDVARFKHEDLDAATKLLTGTLAGNTRAVKQLGIVLQPVTTNMDALKAKYKQLGEAIPPAEKAQAALLDKQVTAASALQLVTDKVQGQAEAFSKTAAGGMEQFHAQTQHLGESLGTVLLPALTTVSIAVAGAAAFLAEHKTVAEALTAVVGTLAAALIAVSVASKLAAAGEALATAAQWAFNVALDANPIGLVVLGLAALATSLAVAWAKSETFRTIVTGSLAAVEGAGRKIAEFFTGTLPAAFEQTLSWVRGHWPVIATLISGPFAPLVALATNAFGVRSALLNAFGDVVAFMGTLPAKFATVATVIAGALKAPINVVISAWDAIGFDFDIPKIHIPFVGDIGGGHVSWHVPQIPLLAAGGIVTGPTLAMLGEAGPEAVIPLGSASGLGGGVHIHLHAGTIIGSSQEFQDSVVAALARFRGRNGLAIV